ncbi:hypothetical protein ZOD2009_07164 [Haladaptatus paucihalophilus DX253]|uniref:YggT family protein n=1 Tax=Haladaptatus paucihalophilus DX253 TaxID=797209 RepID=E7QRL0_HALPU|nr:hypothetical protein ZOD2009_07164 [Haladaptatus paucihalophilus DX253]SHK17222.1 hypothetical protein SAMN05444342_0828 [Haladaptatus paucihalophilus DX253]
MGFIWFLIFQYYARILLGIPENPISKILDALLEITLMPLDILSGSVVNTVEWGDIAQFSMILVYTFIVAIFFTTIIQVVRKI